MEWPHQEAERIIKRFGTNRTIVLETGFGPSGLPHIGTFGEIVRTGFVMQALKDRGVDAKCIVFSDDKDALRKVPLGMPDWLNDHVGRPLSTFYSPYDDLGRLLSYAGYMNLKLLIMLEQLTRRFREDWKKGHNQLQAILMCDDPDEEDFIELDLSPFEFKSSSNEYDCGNFDEGLRKIAQNRDKIIELVAPTLSEEKRANWDPFHPLCRDCGFYAKIDHGPERELEVSYTCDRCNTSGTLPYEGYRLKVGWKVDWALRWYTFGVNYEMYGKDLIESATLSKKIVKIMGGKAPIDYFYEMFLDEDGKKISKSVGKGVTVEQWLRYGTEESLKLFMYRNPRRQKKLYLKAIPQYVDEAMSLAHQEDVAKFVLPSEGAVKLPEGLTFGTIVSIASSVGTNDVDVVTEFIEREYNFTLTDETKTLAEKAVRFYDEVLREDTDIAWSEDEKRLMKSLANVLETDESADYLHGKVFALANEQSMKSQQAFRAIYLAITRQEKGPRLGAFIKLLGQDLVRERLLKACDE